MARYAVAGATSWGLTLAWLLSENGHAVHVLCRTPEEAAALATRRGLARLPGLVLPERVRATADRTRFDGVQGIVLAVPAQAVAVSLSGLPRGVPVLSAAKGIDHTSGRRLSEICTAAGWDADLVAVLSGPNLAPEVARGLPAAAVVASSSAISAIGWQQALSRPVFRLYTSEDVIGVEMGGALKNIVAIAAGAAAGLEFGANAIAAIVTRGLAEITRLGVALGALPVTFQGLAGVGDLTATCFSPLSRNRRLGALIATGMPVPEALDAIGGVAEGAQTAPVALRLSVAAGVEMPITAQVCAVLAGATSVRAAMGELLTRPLRPEARAAGTVLN